MDACKICHRIHDKDMPCPLRIANAYTMRAQRCLFSGHLTDADKKWMHEHPNFSVLDAVENTIVELM